MRQLIALFIPLSVLVIVGANSVGCSGEQHRNSIGLYSCLPATLTMPPGFASPTRMWSSW